MGLFLWLPPGSWLCLGVVGLFFLLLFSQLSSLGMESANHGRGLAMEKGI